MTTLVLHIEGPMQSWGTHSRFTERDTAREPTKSGIIGLICAAMGRERDKPLDDLVKMKFAVRVEKEGMLEEDFQTVLDVPKASKGTPDTVISKRYFLSDARFLVFLEGDTATLRKINDALSNPKWPLFLGRKAFVPTRPIVTNESLKDGTIDSLIKVMPWTSFDGETKPDTLRTVVECPIGEGEPLNDVPINFSTRKFGVRYVRNTMIPAPV